MDAMNIDLLTTRAAFLSDLQTRVSQLKWDSRREMFLPGVWSGILNALDANSSHCVQSLKDTAEWYLRGLEYLADFENKKMDWRKNFSKEELERIDSLCTFKQQIGYEMDCDVDIIVRMAAILNSMARMD